MVQVIKHKEYFTVTWLKGHGRMDYTIPFREGTDFKMLATDIKVFSLWLKTCKKLFSITFKLI